MAKSARKKPVVSNPATDDADTLWGDVQGVDGTLLRAGKSTKIDALGGDDMVYGDAQTISGRARGGNDKISGGDGADALYGDAGVISDKGRGGNDFINGDAGTDIAYGDATSLRDRARGGNDGLWGGGDNDILYGDAATMSGSSRGGNDRLDGGEADDILYGDAEIMQASARAGNDRLYGGAGNDMLYGDALTSEEGVRSGNDLLNGGEGNDQMWGGKGNDVFIFVEPGSGVDTIHDFGRSSGDQDRIDLTGYGLTWADLEARIDYSATDATITLSTDLDGLPVDTLTLVGVDSSMPLTAADFILAA